MSLADINDHINRCSEAQIQAEKSASPKLPPHQKKLKLDVKGNVIWKEKEAKQKARAESMKMLEMDGTKEAFEYLLLKHLDF